MDQELEVSKLKAEVEYLRRKNAELLRERNSRGFFSGKVFSVFVTCALVALAIMVGAGAVGDALNMKFEQIGNDLGSGSEP